MKTEENDAELTTTHLLNSSRHLMTISPSLSASMRHKALSIHPAHAQKFLQDQPLKLTACAQCGSPVRFRVNGKRQEILWACRDSDCGFRGTVPVDDCDFPDTTNTPAFGSDLPCQVPSNSAIGQPGACGPSSFTNKANEPTQVTEAEQPTREKKKRTSRPGLAQMLARRQAEEAQDALKSSAEKNRLESFLTQL